MKTHCAFFLRHLFACAVALAAALLALAPRRAAADPPAIFVNTGNSTIPSFTATGGAATGYTAPTGFSGLQGLAYDPANNTLYAADYSTNQIRTFNATTGAETQLGFAGAIGLKGPEGLAYGNGLLYAANLSTNTVTAYNAATGAQVTTGFTSPSGLSQPFGLAVTATTLYVTNSGNNTLGAYDLLTGVATFTISGLRGPLGVALYGNDLFVANYLTSSVGEYNALTGAVINPSFVTGLSNNYGLAILSNQLLVVNNANNTVGAYGIPATPGNGPTSSNPNFITGLTSPRFIAAVPEPGTWALLGVGAGMLALAVRCPRVRVA